MKNILIIFSSILLLASCNSRNDNASTTTSSDYHQAINGMKPNAVHQVRVVEKIDVGTYTYLRLNEAGKKYWAAISSRPIDTGKQYYYKEGMMMNNFTSKQLNRTFDTILFIQNFSDQAFVSPTPSKNSDYSPEDNTHSDRKPNISVDVPKNGVHLEEIFKNGTKYSGQSVIVRGVISKMNKMIMGRNWIHIQDGSSYENFYDLTITTEEDMDFSLGDTVTFKGIISLNKDFGAGYRYDFIMENAHILK